VTFLYLVPVGPIEEGLLSSTAAALERTVGLASRRMSALEDPDYAFDPKRNQFASSTILTRLMRQVPADASRLLALTERDLFIPILSFVFGQAQLNGPAAIISLARLRQEFYGLQPEEAVLLARTVKEALHEVGHTFGLVHCENRMCLMSLSTNIRQVDVKGSDFCPSCSILVRESVGMIKKKAASGRRGEE
jgi:archaemetzincin